MSVSTSVARIHVAGYSTNGTASHPSRPEPVNYLIMKFSLTSNYNWDLSVYGEVADEISIQILLSSRVSIVKVLILHIVSETSLTENN
jgi:hypothetical protein